MIVLWLGLSLGLGVMLGVRVQWRLIRRAANFPGHARDLQQADDHFLSVRRPLWVSQRG